ncbi:anti-sigma factor domain-containing protein [Alicyclobacillus sp. ALC3]|uniref:anti-sigma factor domain-containing protein n=1 Tax=Alicyclobacillus sp. ALC3 TaxID=2796143 RepID=UPI0023780EB2|nr:anti-sigma factor domain-containing protein [Alicyclobacillus sp. ALC3]WDL96180.1 anti-sigma factor domain-containing protein [Alicyclobacillus sp. ALC3]
MHGERRGVVVQIAKKHAIVLTPDGQFCRVARVKDVAVGMELSFEEEQSSFERRTALHRGVQWRRWTSVVAAACLAVAVGVWAGHGGRSQPQVPTGTPYALVSLDINPSVTLGVNPRMYVQTASANDKDGKTVLSQLPHLSGESLQQAVSQIVSQALKDKLVPTKDSIVIAAAPVQQAANAQVSTLVATARQTVLQTLKQSGASQGLHPSVYTVSMPQSVFTAAQQANILPGEVASYLLAQQHGLSVSHLNATIVGQIFGNGNSILSIDTTKSTEQITSMLDQLKISGIFSRPSTATRSGGTSSNKGTGVGQRVGTGGTTNGTPPPRGGGTQPASHGSSGSGPGGSGSTISPGSGLTNEITNIVGQSNGTGVGPSPLLGNTLNTVGGLFSH